MLLVVHVRDSEYSTGTRCILPCYHCINHNLLNFTLTEIVFTHMALGSCRRLAGASLPLTVTILK